MKRKPEQVKIYINALPISECLDSKFYLHQILISDFAPVTTVFSVLFGNSKVKIYTWNNKVQVWTLLFETSMLELALSSTNWNTQFYLQN